MVDTDQEPTRTRWWPGSALAVAGWILTGVPGDFYRPLRAIGWTITYTAWAWWTRCLVIDIAARVRTITRAEVAETISMVGLAVGWVWLWRGSTWPFIADVTAGVLWLFAMAVVKVTIARSDSRGV